MLVAWVVFPLVLAALCLGCGLLVERLSGLDVESVLLLPLGLAALIVVAGLATMSSATAPLATPAVVAVSLAGFSISPPLRRRVPGAALAGAGGAFAVFAAPVVASGSTTIPGWIKLDDTATWLALTDRAMHYGRSVAGLAPSTYELVLSTNFAAGYPLGAFLPLGVGGQLVGQDLAWLFQPYQAFLAAMLALTIYSLASRAVHSRALCGLVAFAGAQASLYYGYALWGGVKEVAATPLIALVAALLPGLLARDAGVRAVIPIAVAVAATLGVLTAGGAVWLAPALLGAAVLLWRKRGWRVALRASALLLVVAAALSAPTIAISRAFSSSAGVLTSGDELGNLLGPLRFEQVLGIWPVGDFRLDPRHLGPTYVLLAVVAAGAAYAVVQTLRRRTVGLSLFLGSALVGAIVLTVVASPWVGAKGLASASPALVATALVGGCLLLESGRRVEGALALVAIVGGVLWSNTLQYHDVSLAPHEQLAELATIGHRFAGDGPALMMEYSPYGARHFLRALDPESAGEFRYRQVSLRGEQAVAKGGYADIDEVATDAVLVYRTLVLNRSPLASRPPSIYRLVWHGRFYDVWQRPAEPKLRVVDHLELETPDQAVATPRCSSILRLAGEALRAGGRLEAVPRPASTVFPLSEAVHPAGWATYSATPDVIYPSRSGTLEAKIDVPASGRYEIWLGGSFRRHLSVLVDGGEVGSGRDELDHPGVYTPMGQARLAAGTHDVVLRYSSAELSPGSGGPIPAYAALGPLVLGRDAAEFPVQSVAPSHARSLCGRSLDWVEVVAAA